METLSDRHLPPCIRANMSANITDSCAPYGVCTPIAAASSTLACACGIYRDPAANCTSLYHIIPEWRQDAYIATLFVAFSAVLVFVVLEILAAWAKGGAHALFKRPTGYVLVAVLAFTPFKLAAGALATLDVIGGEPLHAATGAAVHLVGQNFLVLGYMGAATVWMTFLMRYQNLGEPPSTLRAALAGCIICMAVMVVNGVLTIVVYAAGQTLPDSARAALQATISFLPVISIGGISLATGPLRWRYVGQVACRPAGRRQWINDKRMRYFYVRSIVLTLAEIVSVAYVCYLVPSQLLWITNRAVVQQLLLETTLAWQLCTATFLIFFAGNFDRPHVYARAFGLAPATTSGSEKLSSSSTGRPRDEASASTSSTIQTSQAE